VGKSRVGGLRGLADEGVGVDRQGKRCGVVAGIHGRPAIQGDQRRKPLGLAPDDGQGQRQSERSRAHYRLR